MKRRIYLCEGETEQRLVKALIEGELIAPGQQRVFNTAQNDVKKMLRRWGWGPVKFVLVVDADTGPYDMSSRLAENLKTLEKSHKPKLVLQCDNLEDELGCCCSITGDSLYRAFNASSASEFKKKFIKVRQEQLLEKLNRCGFDFDRLWQRCCEGNMLNSGLRDYLWKKNS